MDSFLSQVELFNVKNSHDFNQPDSPFPLRVRIVQIIFVIIGVILTLFLAWWQYTRWQSTDGTFQNLGYAIQWPIFGAFLVISYRKYIQYERERMLGDDEAAVKKVPEGQLTEIPDAFLQQPSEEQRSEAAEDLFQDTRRRDSRSAGTPRESTDRNRANDTNQ